MKEITLKNLYGLFTKVLPRSIEEILLDMFMY